MRESTGLAINERVLESSYVVRDVVGDGLYRVEHVECRRRALLRVMSSHIGVSSLQRLREKSRVLRELEHPNILPVHEVRILDGGDACYITDGIDGRTLGTRLKLGPLPLRDALLIAAQVLDALSAAHEARVVHGGIQPEAVLIEATGQVRLLDFGVPNSPMYFSPEHARGDHLGTRCDLYCVGLLLFEMISGMSPFGALQSPSDYLDAHRIRPPTRLADQVSQAPLELSALIEQLLAKRMGGRPCQARDVAGTLRLMAAEELRREADRIMWNTTITKPKPAESWLSRQGWVATSVSSKSSNIGYRAIGITAATLLLATVQFLLSRNSSAPNLLPLPKNSELCVPKPQSLPAHPSQEEIPASGIGPEEVTELSRTFDAPAQFHGQQPRSPEKKTVAGKKRSKTASAEPSSPAIESGLTTTPLQDTPTERRHLPSSGL